MTRLGVAPLVHPAANVRDSTLGLSTEVGAACTIAHSSLGDYSYCVENTQIAYSEIGRFANIASHVRVYASMHPHQRPSLHHFTYRSNWYFEGEEDDAGFFAWRAGQTIRIGYDSWIGHGAVIMPGVTIGHGTMIGANAVVTRDVADFAVAVGVPARTIRQRFPDAIAVRLLALGWWEWDHERLRNALPGFRTLGIEAFLEKCE